MLEQPAPVELSATLELAADFAKVSKAPATQLTEAIIGIGVPPAALDIRAED